MADKISEKITIHVEYGSEFQRQVFSPLIRGTLSGFVQFFMSKHKKNRALLDGMDHASWSFAKIEDERSWRPSFPDGDDV